MWFWRWSIRNRTLHYCKLAITQMQSFIIYHYEGGSGVLPSVNCFLSSSMRFMESRVKSWPAISSLSNITVIDMRQCQIRVRFEYRGMQFFKVLGKWLSMTKYLPIIVLWCSERGFYKKNHLVTCFKFFYRCPTSLGNVHTYVRVSWCRNFIKSFQYSLRNFVCYAN